MVEDTATFQPSTSGAVIRALAGKPFADPPQYGTALCIEQASLHLDAKRLELMKRFDNGTDFAGKPFADPPQYGTAYLEAGGGTKGDKYGTAYLDAGGGADRDKYGTACRDAGGGAVA
ncbi:hypothetical protein T484DRAFT_1761724 [Baffinella frigidus]|nr:hypothetical protein T484DRAFT_1761724 [Cryptophyta sp. CCMP2293]